MDSPDQYAIKGHDLMRKAQKVLKGKHPLNQAHFSAISLPINHNVLKKHLRFISKRQLILNWLNYGINQQKHTYKQWNVIKLQKEDNRLICMSKQLT